MVSSLYRKIIPLSVRSIIYEAFLGSIIVFIRNFKMNTKSKFVFLFQWILHKTDENIALAFMGRYGLTSYPYPHMLEYKNMEIKVEFDSILRLPFVMHNNKKLYFQKSYTTKYIIRIYRSLLIEQDIRSAHRYVKSYDELRSKILLDIGSAEGIFALDTIELVDHVYLFECDQLWVEALQATFNPWREKVTIIRKYVGNKTNDNFTTIDDFLKDKIIDNLFLKMDIEGAEKFALSGAINTLKKGKNINLAVCTYHIKNDPEVISNFMASLGYAYEFSNGLMYWARRLSKGLIRCQN
jgi:hypothetical protein